MNLIKIYFEFNKNIKNPISCQEDILQKITTKFNISNNYTHFKKIELFDVRNLNRYNENLIKTKKFNFFAQTSGTNKIKQILVSKNYIKENHYKASKFLIYNISIRIRKKDLIGLNLALSGYKYQKKKFGLQIIDISELLLINLPYIYKKMIWPKRSFTSWSEKIKYLKAYKNELKNIKMVSGVPTWVLSLFREIGNDELKNLFPNLKLYIHGGVNFENYKSIFSNLNLKNKLQFYEVYNATEGFFGIQYNLNKNQLLLLTNCAVFYEFKNLENKKICTLKDIKVNTNYELIISNTDGLIRYPMKDIVNFESKQPPLFVIKGRTNEFINAFGEDLSIDNVNQAINNIKNKIDFIIHEFFIVPNFGNLKSSGHHDWYILFRRTPNLKRFTQILDSELCRLNNNYKQKRNGSLGMKSLVVNILSDKNIENYFINTRDLFGGQLKIKRLHNNRKIIDLI